jgi:hypothetical protein
MIFAPALHRPASVFNWFTLRGFVCCHHRCTYKFDTCAACGGSLLMQLRAPANDGAELVLTKLGLPVPPESSEQSKWYVFT